MRTFVGLSTVHLDGDLRAHDRAQGTSSAGFLEKLRRMVTFFIIGFSDADGLFRAHGETELATLAHCLIYGNFSFSSHNLRTLPLKLNGLFNIKTNGCTVCFSIITRPLYEPITGRMS
jgi:hypothetical protein